MTHKTIKNSLYIVSIMFLSITASEVIEQTNTTPTSAVKNATSQPLCKTSEPTPKSRTIKISNTITEDQLAVRYFGSSHRPDSFSIEVNGSPLFVSPCEKKTTQKQEAPLVKNEPLPLETIHTTLNPQESSPSKKDVTTQETTTSHEKICKELPQSKETVASSKDDTKTKECAPKQPEPKAETQEGVQNIHITVHNNQIYFDYHYSFAKGFSRGSKRAYFEVPPDIDTLHVSFSFEDDRRVIVPEATLISIDPIST